MAKSKFRKALRGAGSAVAGLWPRPFRVRDLERRVARLEAEQAALADRLAATAAHYERRLDAITAVYARRLAETADRD